MQQASEQHKSGEWKIPFGDDPLEMASFLIWDDPELRTELRTAVARMEDGAPMTWVSVRPGTRDQVGDAADEVAAQCEARDLARRLDDLGNENPFAITNAYEEAERDGMTRRVPLMRRAA